MQTKNFADLITFTRATTGLWLNPATGLLETAAINVPRLEAKGLLFEAQRTNLLRYSNTLSASAWLKSAVSVTSDSALDPEGNIASKITEDGNDTAHRVRAAISPSPFGSGATVCASVYAKASERTMFQIAFNSSGAGVGPGFANFNLTDGSVISGNGAVGYIEPLPNGWYRCIVVYVTTGDGSGGYNQYHSIITDMGVSRLPTHQGIVGQGLYLYGAQCEASNGWSSYIPTEASQVTRAADLGYVPLSDWLREDEGTLFIEASLNGVANNQYIATLGTSSTIGRITHRLESGGSRINGQVIADNDVTSFSSTLGPAISPGQIFKGALGYSSDDFQNSSSGLISAVGPAAPLPTVDRLVLGARGPGTDPMTGHIRRIKYFPYRLAAAELQALTT